ncbi:hypothetical protein KXR83_05805 [Williamsia muralis]|uniref:phage tail protein n=1 Tax=Williamsia marianensis TaxID=85044 RepID=UPI003F165CE1
MATYTAGSARVPLVPDLRDFHRTANRKIEARRLRAKVELIPDVQRLQSRLNGSSVSIKTQLKIDIAQFKQDVKALSPVQVKLEADLARLQARLQSSHVRMRVQLEIDRAHLRAQIESLPVYTVRAIVRLDDTAARGRLETLARDRTVDVNVNTRGSKALSAIAGGAGSLATSMLSATASVGKFLGIAGSLVVVAGSAVPVIGALAASVAAVGGAAAGAGVAGLSAMIAVVGTLKVATSGVADAFTNAFDPEKAEEFYKALAKLSPQAQDFVLSIRGVVGAWKEMGAQTAVQDALFAGLGAKITHLGDIALPAVRDSMLTVADGFNEGAASALNFLTSVQGAGMLEQWLTASANMGANLGSAIGNLVPGLLAVGTTASEVFSPMTDGMAGAARGMSDWLIKARESGELAETIRGAVDTAKQFGAVLADIGGIISGVFSAAQAGSGSVLGSLGNTISLVNDWVNSFTGQEALTSFFQSVTAAVSAVLPVFLDLAGIIGGQVAPVIADIAVALGPVLIEIVRGIGYAFAAFAPAIPPLVSVIGMLGTTIANLMPVVGPVLGKIVTLFASLLAAVLPILEPLITLAAGILTPLADALTLVVDALAPVIGALVGALMPVIQALMPVFADLVNIFATFLVDAINQLLPVLQPMLMAFGQLVVALLPLIPPLLQVAIQLFPTLVTIIAAVLPIVTELITNFTKLVNFLVPILIPVIERVSSVVTTVFNAVASVISGVINNTIVPALRWFGDRIDNVVSIARQAPEWIQEKWNSLVDFFTGLPGRIGSAVSGMWDGIKNAFKDMLNTIIDWWNGLSLGWDKIEVKFGPDIPAFHLDMPDIPRLRTGGPLAGGTSPNKDDIPLLGAKGEFMMQAAAVDKYGLSFMELINAGKFGGAFATGGSIGGATAATPLAAAGLIDTSLLVSVLQQIAVNTGATAAAVPAAVGAAGGAAGAATGGDPAADPIAATAGMVTPLVDTALPAFATFAQGLADTKATLIDPVFAGIETATTGLGTAFTTQLGVIATPAWSLFGTNLSLTNAGIIQPTFGAVQASLGATGLAFVNTVNGTINPQWLAAGNHIRAVQTGPVETAFRETRDSLMYTANTFGPATGMIATQWSGVKEGTAAPVRYTIGTVFNDGLVGMWNSVTDLIGTSKMAAYPIRFATGGVVPGGGAPRADDVPALLSSKEFVAPVDMISDIGGGSWSRGAGMLESARRRSLGPKSTRGMGAEGLFSAYADGGVAQGTPAWNALKRGHDFARHWNGSPYVWGGSFGPNGGTDCSGYMSSIADVILGGNGLMRQWATGSFPGGGGSQGASGPQGFVQGLGAGFSIGVSTEHTAGTLGGVPGLPTVNVESGGSHGNVAYGGPAVGADSGQFPSRYHLAIVDGSFVSAGGGGGTFDPSAMAAEMQKPFIDKVNASLAAYKQPGIVGELPPKTWDKMKGAADSKINAKIQEMLASGGMGPLGSGSEFYAKEIIAAAKLRNLGPDGAAIGVATAIVESGLKMYANAGVPESLSFPHDAVGSDHDSVGLFQQRQAGWGTLQQRMNPRASAGLFFDRLMSFDWRSMDPGAAAQKVQVSAFPDRYGQAMPQARGLVTQLGYDGGGWLDPGISTVFNGFRKPEAILSPAESEAFLGIANQFLDDARSGSSYTGQHVENQWVVDPDEITAKTSRAVRQAIRQDVTLGV